MTENENNTSNSSENITPKSQLEPVKTNNPPTTRVTRFDSIDKK